MNIQEQAFKVFDSMKISDVIIIREFAKKDPGAFIQYGKNYIDNGGSIEFNHDYSKIRKVSSMDDLVDADKYSKN
ncbi:hypothetical protein TH53_19915 [Pedobacter lusitanus]|uniref:Uncharacterized protein n=1 Tax=Pedobacter lusitanus TaxID=1503925 RepID=A0A0D0GE39_9SPHI|nr:hypothetical protein [Pedobacter lusitanus]KIO75607.1 hypothetical protein TH53_19915 [Pedobacter lusitanus]